MASLASINIRFAVDLREFSSEMQNSLRTIDQVGQKFQAVGRSMSAFVTLPILAAGAAAVKFASDYQESLNKVDVAFKSNSTEVKEFSKNSLESFGIANGTALDMAAAYGDMGTSMGLTTGQAAKMSTSLVGLAGDLASFKNISIDIANTAISAIFTGETESLKKLGIVMTEVNLKQFALNSGIKKNYEVMTQAEKVQLRYNYILSVTKNAQGDFERTQGGAANQTRIFTESLKQVGQQLGAVILPLFTKVITAVNEKIKAFGKLSEGTKTTIVVIAGLVAVIGPLLLGIGAILSIIPMVVAGFAIVSGAIIPILAGLALLTGAIIILKNGFADTAKATVQLTSSQKLIQSVTDEATASIVDQKAQLESLFVTARNENETKANKLKAIQAINRVSPEYLGNITLENINTDKARVALEKYNAALLAGATARAASRLLEQNQTDKIKAGFEKEKVFAESIAKIKNAQGLPYKEYESIFQKANYEMEVANATLLEKNKLYDNEVKLLTNIYNKNKQNLDLLNGDTVTPDVVAPAKAKKVKAPTNLSPIENEITTRLSTGTIESYDAEIAKLIEFRDQIATTAEQIKLANEKIAGIELAKALNFDPSSVIKSVETTEEMMGRLAASVSGAKAVIEVEQNSMIANANSFNEQFSTVWQNTIGGFAENFGALIGQFAAGGASLSSIGNLFLTTLADMAIQVGKIAISVGIAVLGIKKALESLNPVVAIAAGIALIALGTFAKTSLAKSSGQKTQAFANGGIVSGSSMYGDKILARVNSGELIANNEQQKKIWGAMNSGGGGVSVIPSIKLVGSDFLIMFDRAQARKNRTS
jgi:hypothetical protein